MEKEGSAKTEAEILEAIEQDHPMANEAKSDTASSSIETEE